MQPGLFDPRPRFDGSDYQIERDTDRLTSQLAAIKTFVLDGRWHTLKAISNATGAPEASASAQLRHLKKRRHGAYTVEKRYVGRGLYEYRVRK